MTKAEIMKLADFYNVERHQFSPGFFIAKDEHDRLMPIIEALVNDRDSIIKNVIEQIDLAEENWDTNLSIKDGFNTLRDNVMAITQMEKLK